MKMIQATLYSLLFTLIFSTQSQLLATENTLPWNIVIYMEASAGHLYQAAFKNLDEIVRNSPAHAHVFVFLHTQGDSGWLYHITKNNLHKITDISCDISVAETLINVMAIAVDRGPAERYGLVLWNHGYGILDPVYDAQLNDWVVPYDGPYNVGCSLKRSHNIHHQLHRGICVTNQPSFLSNEDMVYAFDVICNILLDGQKLAFCGMDLCKGAMFEHAYQLADYTDYLLGSQECEMLDGWPYDNVLQIINDAPDISTQDIVIHTVNAFHQYYEIFTEQNNYTLSALDLRYVESLKDNIDSVAAILMYMLLDNDNQTKNILKQLRKQCKAFCDAPMYCDLQQWYSMLLSEFDGYYRSDENPELGITLERLLIDGLELMSDMTVARCHGSASTHAHGCSIYFPQFAIDRSYLSAPFAQESYWLLFLKYFLA